MTFHHLAEAQHFTIPGGTEGVLYPPGANNSFSLAVVKSNGRYPEKGMAVNDVCTESIYVSAGEMVIAIDGQEYLLHVGDMLCIEPGHAYTITGTATCIDIITPAWDSAQNHVII